MTGGIVMEGYPHIKFREHWEISSQTEYHLGECEAMVRAISNTPLRPQDRGKLLTVSLVKGAQATTAIEGNTLTQEEVERIFEGEELPPSREYLQKEVKNVIDAFNWLLDKVVRDGKEWPVTPELIQKFHMMISRDLGEHLDAIPGRWREDRRQVGPYLTPEHRHVPGLIDKLCKWIKEEFHFHKNQDFRTAVIQAIVTHVYIEWIHPFGDGNGRTGRMIEFFVLLRAGLPSIASHILSNFYNQTRTDYYRQLNIGRKQQSLTNFIEYAVLGFRDGLVENLKIIQAGQLKIFWRNHIFESFSDIQYTKRNVFKRKRDLMLSAPIDRWLTPDEIITTKTEVIKEYASLGTETLKRDLKELIKMGLLVQKGKLFHANTQTLQASLPEKK